MLDGAVILACRITIRRHGGALKYNDMMNKGTLDFYELVERALEGLPPELSRLLDNVAIVVEDWPDYSTPLVADSPGETLYGLYEGVPLTERGAGYYGFLPDKITIFRGPLERDFKTDELE